MADNIIHYTEPTSTYWQEIIPPSNPDKTALSSRPPWRYGYPAKLPDGSTLMLPIRQLPKPTSSSPLQAVASLIVNQASLSVVEKLGSMLVALIAPFAPDVLVALPTLGLSLAPVAARGLGHSRYVPLGYSVKFWYEERLSVPVSSITSPAVGAKRLYLDPNMVPLLLGDVEDERVDGGKRRKRVALIDDAISSGTTIVAARRMLEEDLGVSVVAVGVAMRQGGKWREAVGQEEVEKVVGVFDSPLLKAVDGGWAIRDQ